MVQREDVGMRIERMEWTERRDVEDNNATDCDRHVFFLVLERVGGAGGSRKTLPAPRLADSNIVADTHIVDATLHSVSKEA